MHLDATRLEKGQELAAYDLCIIGAGAAGIAIAKRLIGSSQRVLLVASGLSTDRRVPSGNRERLYEGTVGPFLQRIDPVFLTRSRQRMYGGTTNHFGWWAAPLIDADLRPRPGYREAHWPFGRAELDRYYPDANAFGGFGPFNYEDVDFWAGALRGTPFKSDGVIQNAIFHAQYAFERHAFQVLFGAAIELAPNIDVMFNANALQLRTDDRKGHVDQLVCASIGADGSGGPPFVVSAKRYVLALGGIEPVRLLKLSGDVGDNAAGMLGKGFMLHPLVTNAAYVEFSPNPLSDAEVRFYSQQQVTIRCDGRLESAAGDDPQFQRTTPIYDPHELEKYCQLTAWGVLTPTPAAMDAEKIGNFRVTLDNIQRYSATVNFNWEQVPNAESTVSLDETRRDPIFKQPVVKVDWNLREEDKRTIRRGLELVRDFLTQHGATSFRPIDLDGGPETWPTGSLRAGDHHMGALRMSKSPVDGIVDPNCRVHTVDNLYVAGSGVFPSVGYANPTLTIVAMALRLADHLNGL